MRRVAAALVILIGLPIVALGFYGRYGNPGEPDAPIARLGSAIHRTRSTIFTPPWPRSRSHLIAHPEDGLGFKVVAPAYMRLGRYNDAVKAFSEALRLLGDNPGDARRLW